VVLVNEKIYMTQQSILTAQKANPILGCIKRSVASMLREDSAPLLCSDETPPGVLRPALEPSTQERHGPIGVGPVKGHKKDQRGGTPFL